jgi:chorismate mutase
LDRSFNFTLDELRAQVDALDTEVIAKLGQRMAISEQMGRLKKATGVTILQTSRWSQILADRQAQGVALGLSAEFMTALLKAIHEESISHQHQVMNPAGD